MNDSEIGVLAAIKSFYEEENDLVGIYASIVLSALSGGEIGIEKIQNKITSELKLNIPIEALGTFLKRLKRKNLIIFQNLSEPIMLTPKGEKSRKKIKQTIESHKKAHNSLIKDLSKYLTQKILKKISVEETEKLFERFLKKHIFSSCLMISGGVGEKQELDKNESLIMEFVKSASETTSKNYETLKSILFGNLIASLPNQEKIREGKKIKQLDIYLDTNFVFALIDLNLKIVNESSKELMSILQEMGFCTKIFTFTQDEVAASLRKALLEYDTYSTTIEVDSLGYRLKATNKKKQDIVLLIENLNKKLDEIGIEIDYMYEAHNADGDDADFQEFKSESGKKGSIAIHDYSAIQAIKKIRHGRKINSIEESQALFLTLDQSLFRYMLKKEEHSKNLSIPEAILNSDLASLLWIKNPKTNSDALFKQILCGHLSEKLIKSTLWQTFIEELHDQSEKGKIDSEDIEKLISNNETRKLLFEVQDGEKSKKDIKLFIDANVKKIVKKEKIVKQQIANLKNERASLEESLSSEIEKIKKINQAIEKKCKNRATIIINTVGTIIFILMYVLLVALHKKIGTNKLIVWNDIKAIYIIPIPFMVSFYLGNKMNLFTRITETKRRLSNKLISKCIKRTKRNLNIAQQ